VDLFDFDGSETGGNGGKQVHEQFVAEAAGMCYYRRLNLRANDPEGAVRTASSIKDYVNQSRYASRSSEVNLMEQLIDCRRGEWMCKMGRPIWRT
jgi:hypothetical protein